MQMSQKPIEIVGLKMAKAHLSTYTTVSTISYRQPNQKLNDNSISGLEHGWIILLCIEVIFVIVLIKF